MGNKECLAGHGPDKFCEDYDCRTVLWVAAEAREEGIDKMLEVAHLCNDTRRFPGAVLSAQEFERWVDGEMDKMAERLRKKGK